MNPITRILLYDASYAVGFALMLLHNILTCKIYKIGRIRASLYTAVTFLFGLAGAMLISLIYNWLFSLKGITTGIKVDVIGAVIFTSPLLLGAVYTEKTILKHLYKKAAEKDPEAQDKSKSIFFRDMLDLMISGSFLMFATIKLGCMIRGCCWGVECSWGVQSTYINATVFPVQIFECFSLLIILLACFYIRQTGFFRRGMAGPLMALMYGVARFFWEFLRYYTPDMRNFALHLTLWQLLCILIIIVAAIWIAVLCRIYPSEPKPKRKLIEKASVVEDKNLQATKKNTAKKKEKKTQIKPFIIETTG